MGLACARGALDITDVRRPGIGDRLLLRLGKGKGDQRNDLLVDRPAYIVITDQLGAGLLDRGGQQLGQYGVLDPFAAVHAFGLLDELGERLVGRDLRWADGNEEILAVDGLSAGRAGQLLQLTRRRAGTFTETELGQRRNLCG